MTKLIDHVRLHQQATDTSDAVMLGLLCDYITRLDDRGHVPHDDHVIDFLQENLERGPMDIPVPAWQLPMFTDQDREAIVTSVMDELADESLKDRAHEALEDMPLVDVIGYVFPDDVEDLVRMLQSIEHEDYVNGEFLRIHDDGDDHDTMLDFTKRMGLIDEAEESVTERGREFIERFS